jgi:hypothetical protein
MGYLRLPLLKDVLCPEDLSAYRILVQFCVVLNWMISHCFGQVCKFNFLIIS